MRKTEDLYIINLTHAGTLGIGFGPIRGQPARAIRPWLRAGISPERKNGKFHCICDGLAALPVRLRWGRHDVGDGHPWIAPTDVVCVIVNGPSTGFVVHRDDSTSAVVDGCLLSVVIKHGTLGLARVAGLSGAWVHVPSVIGETSTLFEVKKPAAIPRVYNFLADRCVPICLCIG